MILFGPIIVSVSNKCDNFENFLNVNNLYEHLMAVSGIDVISEFINKYVGDPVNKNCCFNFDSLCNGSLLFSSGCTSIKARIFVNNLITVHPKDIRDIITPSLRICATNSIIIHLFSDG